MTSPTDCVMCYFLPRALLVLNDDMTSAMDAVGTETLPVSAQPCPQPTTSPTETIAAETLPASAQPCPQPTTSPTDTIAAETLSVSAQPCPQPTTSPTDTMAAETLPVSAQPSVRARSAVMSAFPWSTDFLLQPAESLSTDPEHEVFYRAMGTMETQIEAVRTLEASDVHKALVLVKPTELTLPKLNKMSANSARKLCGVLSAYKLMDVLYAIRDSPSHYQNPRYGKLPVGGLTPDPKVWPLQDWVQTVNDGWDNLKELWNFGTAAKLRAGSSKDGNSSVPTVEDLTLQAQLFKELYRFNKQTRGLSMLFNLQSAAFHLSFMLKGYSAGEDLAVPNIPDSPDAFYKATIAQSAALTEEEDEFHHTLQKPRSLSQLRHPLYAALLISPLYLLTGRRVSNISWSQTSMLQMAKSIGNQKPELLVRVELEMWKMLLKVATGRASIYPALEAFYENLPIDELQRVDMEDRKFFSAGEAAKSSQNLPTLLVSTNEETSLCKNWPLSQLRSSGRRSNLLVGPSTSKHRGKFINSSSDHNMESERSTEDDESSTGLENKCQEDQLAGLDFHGQMDLGDMQDDEEDEGDNEVGELEEESGDGDNNRMKVDGEEDEKPKRKRRRRSEKSNQKATTPLTKKRKPKFESFVPYQEIEEGTFLNPINVDAYADKMEVTFDYSSTRQRVKGEEFSITDPTGIQHLWQPHFHFQEDLVKFLAFKRLVNNCDTPNGLPRYLVEGYHSSVEVITHAQYQAMSTAEFQKKQHARHILITGMDTEKVEFDESGLQELTNWDTPIPFQDQSIAITHGDMSGQLCIGTLEHILNMARDKEGAIINGLSFPLPLSAIKKNKHSGDIEAWRLTEGLQFCNNKAQYPTFAMRWGLASTAGARHWMHIDCDGLATFVDVISGGKWWVLFRPRLDGVTDPAGHVDVFLNDFDPSEAIHTWDAEAVYLTPGTRLIMKPNTPHAVFTTEHSIVLGGHMYSFANLEDTVNGIIHCFAVDNLVTNTEHPATRVLLFRMMQYLYKFYVQGANTQKNQVKHLPDLTDITSLVGVLALCNFCILGNVLDYNTYGFPGDTYGKKAVLSQIRLRIKYDYNALQPHERRYYTYIRGLAMNLITWIGCNFDVAPTLQENNCAEPIDYLEDFAGNFIHKQAHAILNYKRQAEKKKILGVHNCQAADVQRQLELLFEGNAGIYGVFTFDDPNLSDCDSFSFGPYSWRVTRKSTPITFQELDPGDLGTTKGDTMFSHGKTTGYSTSKDRPISNESGSPDYAEGRRLKRKRR